LDFWFENKPSGNPVDDRVLPPYFVDPQITAHQNVEIGVDVMITIFCDVFANLRRKNGVFLKNQCYDQILQKLRRKYF
jgi:hypothetical protein